MRPIKAPYTVMVEITEDADGWHLPTSEEYERRRKAREFIVKEYQTFPYKGAVHEMPELIRCKDCKHWDYEDSGADGTVQGICRSMCILSDGMFYCAGAERKEE